MAGGDYNIESAIAKLLNTIPGPQQSEFLDEYRTRFDQDASAILAAVALRQGEVDRNLDLITDSNSNETTMSYDAVRRRFVAQ